MSLCDKKGQFLKPPPVLYNDAPLNLLRTSCRKAAKYKCVTFPASAPSHSDILIDGVPQGGRSDQRATSGRNPYRYIVAKGPPSGERE